MSGESVPGPAISTIALTASRVEVVDQEAVALAGHRRLRIHVEPHQRGSRHRAERVDLGPERAERGEDLVRLVLVAEHGAVDDDDLAAAEELGDVRQRRDLQHPGRRADRVRRGLRPLDVRGQDLRRLLPRPDHHAGDELLDLVQRDLHRDDDSEATAAAAQRPEQLRVLRPVGTQERAVRGDDLDGEHALGREAVLAGEPADAAAERVADDADVRRRAVQRGQALLGGRHDHVLPQRTGLDPGATVLRVDLDGAHLAHVEQQRSVERAVRRRRRAPCPERRSAGRARSRIRRRRRRRRPWSAARRRRGAGRLPGSTTGGRRPSDCHRGRRTGDGSWRSWRAPRDGLLKCPEPRTALAPEGAVFRTPGGRHARQFRRGWQRQPASADRRPALQRAAEAKPAGDPESCRRGSRDSTGGAHRARPRSRPSPATRRPSSSSIVHLAPGAVLGDAGDPQEVRAREAERAPAHEQLRIGHPARRRHAAILGIVAAAVAAVRHDLPPQFPHAPHSTKGEPDRQIGLSGSPERVMPRRQASSPPVE